MAQHNQNESSSPNGGAMGVDEWYDLAPIEKKLVFTSLTLGIALLVVFIFAFGVFK